MIRRPPRSTRTDTLFPYTTLFRSPYMRARAGLAITLWRLGDQQAAIDHYRAMLILNPNDNQGIRYLLATALLARDEIAGLKDPKSVGQGECVSTCRYRWSPYQ